MPPRAFAQPLFATLAHPALALCLSVLAGHALAGNQHPNENDEPKIASYSLDVELKVLSDRRNRGLSDTYNQPGAEITTTFAHESGAIVLLQLGSVNANVFNNGDSQQILGAAGYRWGDHNGWHYGVGIAREWFPGAKVIDAPTGFDASFNPTGLATTNFNTTYGVFEFGYKLLEGRYLYVLSNDLRGNNTSVICGSAYLPGVLAGGDPTKAINCYNQGFKHSGGSHLLDLDIKYPIGGQTKLTGHLGYQKLHNFSDGDLFDYRFGILQTQWGLDFGAEIVGASLKNRDLAVVYDTQGRSKRIDNTTIVVSVGKRF